MEFKLCMNIGKQNKNGKFEHFRRFCSFLAYYFSPWQPDFINPALNTLASASVNSMIIGIVRWTHLNLIKIELSPWIVLKLKCSDAHSMTEMEKNKPFLQFSTLQLGLRESYLKWNKSKDITSVARFRKTFQLWRNSIHISYFELHDIPF